MCKLNNAVNVKRIMPSVLAISKYQIIKERLIWLLNSVEKHKKTLAIPIYMVIINFTYHILYAPAEETELCQSSSPPPKRYIQSPGPAGSGSALFGGRLLRCARFGSGQIRNAASRSERRRSGQSSRFDFWFFPSFLLQSSRGLWPGGFGRTDWQEARTEGATQAQRENHGLCAAKPNSGSFAQGHWLIGTYSKDVRNQSASTYFGTGFGRREKKNSLTTEPVQSRFAKVTGLVEHYEKLRQQALSRNLSSGSRLGQSVLVSRGIVAWMQAVSQSLGSILPAPSTVPLELINVPDLLYEDLVHLMGEVVLTLARQEAV